MLSRLLWIRATIIRQRRQAFIVEGTESHLDIIARHFDDECETKRTEHQMPGNGVRIVVIIDNCLHPRKPLLNNR